MPHREIGRSRGLLLAGMLLLGTGGAATFAPPNDHLVNAFLIEGTAATVTATNLEATKEVGEPNHAGNPGRRSVWWKWRAPAAGSVIVDTRGSSFDTLLAAYTGESFAVMSGVAANDDNGSDETSLIAFNAIAGTTYLIAVDGYGAAAGEIHLSLAFHNTPLQRPANDDFTNRIQLTGSFVDITASNFMASKEPGEPNHADELGGASVWWSWTAPRTGMATMDTQGSNFDTLLAVYTGSVLTNLLLVARSDDISTNQPSSLVTFQAAADEVYQVGVDGYAGALGDIQFHVAMQNVLELSLPEALPGGGYRFTITGTAGSACEVESSIDLLNWSRLVTLTNATGEVEFSDLGAPALGIRFYRAREFRRSTQ